MWHFSDRRFRLSPAQKALGTEINPTVFPASEFRSKLSAGNPSKIVPSKANDS